MAVEIKFNTVAMILSEEAGTRFQSFKDSKEEYKDPKFILGCFKKSMGSASKQWIC